MAKVSIRTPEHVAVVRSLDGGSQTTVYFSGENCALHLHRYDVPASAQLSVATATRDRMAYVWQGAITIAGHKLAAGSSFMVESDAACRIETMAGSATVLIFAGSPRSAPKGRDVYLLPTEDVPRSDDLGGGSGVSGGIHADSSCPTNTLWLHENHMPGPAGASPGNGKAGIHSHSEDEIIFVTGGEMRLGARLFGSGTALMIAADTLYSFTPGEAGVSFVNFRAARPSDIRFLNGMVMSETDYWRDRLPPPAYITVNPPDRL